MPKFEVLRALDGALETVLQLVGIFTIVWLTIWAIETNDLVHRLETQCTVNDQR